MTTDNQMLLPCPFCGGKPYVFWETNTDEHREVGCRECNYHFICDEKDVKKVWNHRADLQRVPDGNAEALVDINTAKNVYQRDDYLKEKAFIQICPAELMSDGVYETTRRALSQPAWGKLSDDEILKLASQAIAMRRTEAATDREILEFARLVQSRSSPQHAFDPKKYYWIMGTGIYKAPASRRSKDAELICRCETVEQAHAMLKSFDTAPVTQAPETIPTFDEPAPGQDNPLLPELKKAVARIRELEAQVPDGWKLVPKVPTQEMYDAGKNGFNKPLGMQPAHTHTVNGMRMANAWTSMLSAAPQPQSETESTLANDLLDMGVILVDESNEERMTKFRDEADGGEYFSLSQSADKDVCSTCGAIDHPSCCTIGCPDELETVYIWFADNGNIRKWSHSPFPEGVAYHIEPQEIKQTGDE